MKGDIYLWDAAKPKPSYNKDKALKRAIDGYGDAAKNAPDKDFEAAMYLKMGNAYTDLGNNPDKAKEYYQKALDTAPSSQAAKMASDRMK